MNCPHCRTPLLTIEVDGIELDYCGDDLGVWFDEGEIEALFESTLPVLHPDPTAKHGKRRCPRCRSRLLIMHPVKDLEVDVCPHGDGVWFDAGEVGRLAAALELVGGAGLGQFEKIFAHVSRMIGGSHD